MKNICTLLFSGLLTLLLAQSIPAQELVRINEFLAQNANGLDDEDGDEEDWIELHNAGTTTVNLAGWFLTDATNNLRKWMFPSVTIAPNGYLVVFASNKNRNSGELHTNFRLSDGGEYLALVKSNGVTVRFGVLPGVSHSGTGHFLRPARQHGDGNVAGAGGARKSARADERLAGARARTGSAAPVDARRV